MSARPQSLMRLCRFGVRCLGTALPEPKLASALRYPDTALPEPKLASALRYPGTALAEPAAPKAAAKGAK